MPTGSEPEERAALPPDDAFSMLGNETRIKILQTLGEAGLGEPLSFSELRDRVGISQGSQFNYHLDKLVGHYVSKTDDGYALRPAGSRVVEAVIAGAVTEEPKQEPTRLDDPCPYCGAPTEIHRHQDRLHQYCTECQGTYGHTALPGVTVDPDERGYLGMKKLPPVGLDDRDPDEITKAAAIWNHHNIVRVASELCPRCSGHLETGVTVCEDHDASDHLCHACGYRHAVRVDFECTKCIFRASPFVGDWLMNDPELVEFLVDHDVNPVAPEPGDEAAWTDYEEDVLSVDPFQARFTFTIDGDALTLTLDDDLRVVDATRTQHGA